MNRKNLNDKGQVMYTSIVPIAIIVVIILGAGYLLTKGDISIPGFGGNPKIEMRRVNNFPTVISTSNTVEKQRVVIKSQKELDEYLNLVDSSGLLTLGETIDFDKEQLLAVSTETRGSGGYEIKIRRVYKNEKDGTILVSSREKRPGESCENDQYLNISIDIVAISKTDKEVGFEVIKDIVDCEE